LAWLIVRGKSRWTTIIDSLSDIPFIIPTAALGYSFLLFWSGEEGLSRIFGGGSIVPPGVLLIMLLHFAFSFPVIVRVMVGELLNYREVYEVAARTLGAHPFTAVRTVTLPILKPAIIASFLLAFARSLSETGATVMVAGAFENGPVFIHNAKAAGLEAPMVFVSFILIFLSIFIFFLIKTLAPHIKIPIKRTWPNLEKSLSSPLSVRVRDTVTLLVFFIFVLIPSMFIISPLISALTDGTVYRAIGGVGPWSEFWSSMTLSYTIAVVATLLNALTGLPLAIIIGRRRWGRFTPILDTLINIPIVIPSVALGVSLNIFWTKILLLPEIWALILSHTTITYTYFVRSMSAAIESVPLNMEEAASTLGGKPLTIFRKILFPLTKYSAFSGAILVFTRSVDETGAAIAVSTRLKTVPVLLVDWVKGKVPASTSDIALGIGFLILTSFIILLVFRLVAKWRR